MEKALAEIYRMHSFAQLCNLICYQKFAKKFAKIFTIFGKLAKFEISETFRKILTKF